VWVARDDGGWEAVTDDERQLLILLARKVALAVTRDDRELMLRLIHAIEAAEEREAVEARR